MDSAVPRDKQEKDAPETYIPAGPPSFGTEALSFLAALP